MNRRTLLCGWVAGLAATMFGKVSAAPVLKRWTPEELQPLTCDQAHTRSYVGKPVQVDGWVQGRGANQWGAWFDLLDLQGYQSPAPRCVRVYNKSGIGVPRGLYIVAVGELAAPGQVRLRQATWYEGRKPLARRYADVIGRPGPEPAQE